MIRIALSIAILIWLAATTIVQAIGWFQQPPHEAARLHAWTGQYPLFAAGVAFAFGLLMGHFF